MRCKQENVGSVTTGSMRVMVSDTSLCLEPSQKLIQSDADPYNETDKDGGRMNKAIDEWMVSQIAAGRTPDEIRRALDIDEEEKKAVGYSILLHPVFLNCAHPCI